MTGQFNYNRLCGSLGSWDSIWNVFSKNCRNPSLFPRRITGARTLNWFCALAAPPLLCRHNRSFFSAILIYATLVSRLVSLHHKTETLIIRFELKSIMFSCTGHDNSYYSIGWVTGQPIAYWCFISRLKLWRKLWYLTLVWIRYLTDEKVICIFDLIKIYIQRGKFAFDEITNTLKSTFLTEWIMEVIFGIKLKAENRLTLLWIKPNFDLLISYHNKQILIISKSKKQSSWVSKIAYYILHNAKELISRLIYLLKFWTKFGALLIRKLNFPQVLIFVTIIERLWIFWEHTI